MTFNDLVCVPNVFILKNKCLNYKQSDRLEQPNGTKGTIEERPF